MKRPDVRTLQRLFLASFSAAWLGVVLACGGGGSSSVPQSAPKEEGAAPKLPPQQEATRRAEKLLAEAVEVYATMRAEHCVTQEDYGRIGTGMSYYQVRDICGRDGQELSRVSIAGLTTVMMAWQNPGFFNGSMNVTFQGDEVRAKAQSGLPARQSAAYQIAERRLKEIYEERDRLELDQQEMRAEESQRAAAQKQAIALARQKAEAEARAARAKQQAEQQAEQEARAAAARKREQDAAAALVPIRAQIAQGARFGPAEDLRKLIRDYPGTAAAEQAGNLLDQIGFGKQK